MVRMKTSLRRGIIKAIVRGIQRNADRIFAESQLQCPVDTGFLKNTGVKDDIPGGSRIAYRTSYAAVVHFGAREKPIKGTQIVNVKEYKRKSKDPKPGKKLPSVGYIVIGPHVRKYVSKRLVPIDPKNGVFRVLNKWPERKANPFLFRAVRSMLPYLKEDIGFYLSKVGRVKKV